MEIITAIERRRRWRPQDKLRILAELNEPGTKFAKVARRHEMSRGLLWQWRDAQRHGMLVADEPVFVQPRVAPAQRPSEQPQGTMCAPSAPAFDPGAEADDRIEIVLPDGTAMRVRSSIAVNCQSPGRILQLSS